MQSYFAEVWRLLLLFAAVLAGFAAVFAFVTYAGCANAAADCAGPYWSAAWDVVRPDFVGALIALTGASFAFAGFAQAEKSDRISSRLYWGVFGVLFGLAVGAALLIGYAAAIGAALD